MDAYEVKAAIREHDKDIRELQRHIARLPNRLDLLGGGGGGLSIPIVETLPAIPTTNVQMVYWTSDGAGTGDDQIWAAGPNQTKWHPIMDWTNKDGAPV